MFINDDLWIKQLSNVEKHFFYTRLKFIFVHKIHKVYHHLSFIKSITSSYYTIILATIVKLQNIFIYNTYENKVKKTKVQGFSIKDVCQPYSETFV